MSHIFLRGCHIEPPVLSALFHELKNKGIDLDHSFNIKEVASIIADSKLNLKKSQVVPGK